MKIAIIGGGFTGLSAAYHLSCREHQVTVFEKDFSLGGLAASFKYKNFYLEKFVHHFFHADDEVIKLINDLNLSNKLVWKVSKNAIFYKNAVHPFTNALDLLRFLPLSLGQRFRFGLTSLYLKYQRNYQYFERLPAAEWLEKNMGKKVWQIIWKPLLKKKFGEKYRQISLAWFWARVFFRSKNLGYLLGSLQVLAKKLSQEITGRSGRILVKREVKDLKPLVQKFDKVIVTTSPEIFLQIAKDYLPGDYQRRLRKISYFSALSLVLFLKKELMKDVYWLNINDYRVPFVVCVEHTNFTSSRSYNNQHVVYLETYLDPVSTEFLLNEKIIFKKWTPFLLKINKQFQKNWLLDYRVFKETFAQPIVKVGYRKIIPPMVTPLKNVYFASMCQVYPQDREVNYALKLGRQVAEKILKEKK